MAKTHIVEQGDYLSKIARTFGFVDYKTIWDAPENKDLKEKRKNPNVLFPGDELVIPDKEIREESRATEKKHKFELQTEPLHLRIVLLGLDKKPLDSHECILTVDGEPNDITTPSDGRLDEEIFEQAAAGKLLDKGKSDDKIPTERIFSLKIGHLDPVDEVSGQMARLNNLGYNAGDPTAPPGQTDKNQERRQQLQSAIEEFQCDFLGNNDLNTIKQVVDGICGKHTQAKLLEIHGC